MALSSPAAAQDPFKDLDRTHWAYQAVVDLQQKGILIGYPGDYFKGKRTLTRYEFAIAIRRLLDHLPENGGAAGPAGPQGPQGDVGPAGPAGPAADTSELDNIKKLVDEFKNELQGLGIRVGDIQKKLEALTKDVDAIKARMDRMIHFTGDVFFGFRGNQSKMDFVDYGGALQKSNANLFANADAIHDFHLGVNASLAGDVTFRGDIVISNYLSYQGGSLSASGPVTGPQAINTAGLPEAFGLYQADLNVPVKSIDSTLDVGRIKEKVSRLTMWRPDWDPYFDLPWYDDGAYIMDGVRLTSKLGSVTSQLWAGTFSSVTDDQGNINAPLIGSSKGLVGFKQPVYNASMSHWPAGLPTPGVVPATQCAGLHVAAPIGNSVEVGATLIDFSANSAAVANIDGAGGTAPNNEVVYGADFKYNATRRITVSGEYAKSVEQDSIAQGDNLPNDDNNAYVAMINWSSGGIGATIGTLYVDPRFSAPGYWAKLGNWYNGTNVDVGFARLDYAKGKLSTYVEGDMIEGARNRYAAGGLGTGDRAYGYKGGLGYRLNKTFSLSADYDGALFAFSDATTHNGFPTTRPIMQFITLGAGANLSGNTVLKVAYQMINLSDQNDFFGGDASAGVFTTQIAVHF
jgi:hypothetical protein